MKKVGIIMLMLAGLVGTGLAQYYPSVATKGRVDAGDVAIFDSAGGRFISSGSIIPGLRVGIQTQTGTNLCTLTSVYTGVVAVAGTAFTGTVPIVEGTLYMAGFSKSASYGNVTMSVANLTFWGSAAGAISNYFVAPGTATTNVIIGIYGNGLNKSDVSNVYVSAITGGHVYIAGRLWVSGTEVVGLGSTNEPLWIAASNGVVYDAETNGWTVSAHSAWLTNEALWIAASNGVVYDADTNGWTVSAHSAWLTNEALWIAASNGVVYDADTNGWTVSAHSAWLTNEALWIAASNGVVYDAETNGWTVSAHSAWLTNEALWIAASNGVVYDAETNGWTVSAHSAWLTNEALWIAASNGVVYDAETNGWTVSAHSAWLTNEALWIAASNGVVYDADTNGWTVSAHSAWLTNEALWIAASNGVVYDAETNGWTVSAHSAWLTNEALWIAASNGVVYDADTNGWTVSAHSAWLTNEALWIAASNGVVYDADTNGWTVAAHQAWLTNEELWIAASNGVVYDADTNGWTVAAHQAWLTNVAYGTSDATAYRGDWGASVSGQVAILNTNTAPLQSYLSTSNALGIVLTNYFPLQSGLSGSNDLAIIKTNYTTIPIFTAHTNNSGANILHLTTAEKAIATNAPTLVEVLTRSNDAGSGSISNLLILDFGSGWQIRNNLGYLLIENTNGLQLEFDPTTPKFKFNEPIYVDDNVVLTNAIQGATIAASDADAITTNSGILSITWNTNAAGGGASSGFPLIENGNMAGYYLTNGGFIGATGDFTKLTAGNSTTWTASASSKAYLPITFTNTGIVSALQVTGGSPTNGALLTATNNSGQLGYIFSPSFHATGNGTDFSITTGTWTVKTFPVEEFDYGNCFDGTNFTPSVAGRYLLSGQVTWRAVPDQSQILVGLYKNDVQFKTCEVVAGVGDAWVSPNITVIVDVNSTGTNYFTIKMYARATGTNILNSAVASFFSGSRLP